MPRRSEQAGEADSPCPVLSVPEIRDYLRINAELAVLLDAGHRRVRLEGVEGQRLLVSGLAGTWDAVVEIDGSPGPECAAHLDAPGLTVVCSGRAADGAGLGLKAGRVLFRSGVGVAAGHAQEGGLLVISGGASHRLGLNQRGGTLAALGPVGRLAGERQRGGWGFVTAGGSGSYVGRGRSGGHWVEMPTDLANLPPGGPDAWQAVRELVERWGDPGALPPS